MGDVGTALFDLSHNGKQFVRCNVCDGASAQFGENVRF